VVVIAAVGGLLASIWTVPGVAAAADKATSITTGFVDSCALTSKGGVKCWGFNGDGELGDNTKVDSPKPVTVYGLSKGVKAISSGSYFTCALTTKGGVKCWGSNSYGQLGNGTTVDSPKPVKVKGLSKGVKAISSGNFFACALTTKGAVKCWGANSYGQLGDNSTTSSPKPVNVYGMSKGIKAIGAGGYHSCAITTKGAPKCWGYNGEGALGDNTKVNSSRPVAVYGLSSGIKSIKAGSYSTCALTTKSTVKCWGYNGDGELGDGTTTSSLKPVSAGLGNKVTTISYGDIHGCAVNSSGVVKCWGYNGYGALGDNSTTTSSTPVEVYNFGGKAKSVAAGGYHTCAVTTTGVAKCWGFNAYGQLGDNSTTTSHKPVKVLGIS
jgi:alpha-tubulin suppressor-like RCC1 family protein